MIRIDINSSIIDIKPCYVHHDYKIGANLVFMKEKTSKKRPTSRDVAALAQVAQSTVSYVLSGQRRVSKSTEKRVRAAMKELGYQPHAGARNLRTSKTKVLALALRLDENVDAVETAPYIRAMIASARKQGYDIVLSPMEQGPEDLVRLVSRSICDGIIMMDIETTDPRVQKASDLSIPTVLVGRPDKNLGLDVVDFDTYQVGREIVYELYNTGHRKLLVVGDEENTGQYRFALDLYNGITETALDLDLTVQVIERQNNRWDGFVSIADQLIDTTSQIGIVTRTPQLTDWVTRYLETRNLTPGVDLSLVAYCPDHLAIKYSRPITNISADVDKLCEKAISTLLGKIADPDRKPEFHLITPERLQRRATTCVFPKK